MFIRSGYSAQTRRSRLSGIEHHHHAAHMIAGGADLRPSGGTQPDRRSLAFELAGGQGIDRVLMHLDEPCSLPGNDLTPPLQDERVLYLAHGGGLADVDGAGVVVNVGG